MEKMMLVHPDRLTTLKQSGASAVSVEKKKEEPADIQIARLEDEFITKKEKKKNKEKKKLDDLTKRVKPLLSSNAADMQNIIKENFSSKDQAAAQTILDFLSKLPQVSIIDKRMLIKGQPLTDNVVTVVQDIIDNDVKNVEDVIQMLRGVKPNQSARKRRRVKMSDDVTEDFTEALIPFLSAQEPSSEMRTPVRSTPSTKKKAVSASRIPHPQTSAASFRKTPAKNVFNAAVANPTVPSNLAFNTATAGQPTASSTPVPEYKISGYQVRSPYGFRSTTTSQQQQQSNNRSRSKSTPRTSLQTLLNAPQKEKRGNGALKWLSYDGDR